MKRKLLSILLSVAMVMVMMPSMAFAAEPDTNVAQIGDQGYKTLAEAVEAAGTNGIGSEITLLKNASVDSGGISINKTVTINLNDNDITSSGFYAFRVREGGNLTLTGEGQVSSSYCPLDLTGSASKDTSECVATVDKKVTLLATGTEEYGCYGVIIWQKDVNGKTGTASYGVKLNLDGKVIPSDGAGIFVLGNIVETTGNVPVLNLGSTALVKGTTAIALNGYAKLNVNGATVEGTETAIEARSGETIINNGEFTSTADSFSCNPNSSGTTTTGAAIAIAQHTTKKDIAVTINGGTFNGIKALNESNPQENDPAPQVTLSVTGGTFNGEISTVDVSNFITGGTFSDLSALSHLGANADITIKLGKDIAIDKSIPITKAVTIDLNEKTLTTTVPEVFSISETANVTITGNGTIAGPTGSDAASLDSKAVIGVSGSDATLKVLNGKITAGGVNDCGMYGIYVRDGGNVILGDANGGPTIDTWFAAIGENFTTSPANIVINNGTYTERATPAEDAWWSYFCAPIYAASSGNITINGGTFNGYYGLSSRYVDAAQTLKINGGTFNGTKSALFIDTKLGAAGAPARTVGVTGGTFSTDPTLYIASGYEVTGAGPFTVSKIYVAPPTPVEKDPVSNEGTAGTDDATTNADLTDKVSTSDGKTEAVVDQVIADKIVDKAVENKSTEVVVEATTSAGTSDASQVALPEATVKAIAEKTDAALTIKTDNAEVTLDKDAVNAVADQAGTTGTVKLVVETVENTDEKVVVELKLETSNGYVSDFKGGNVTVTVPVAKDMADKKVVCVYIDDNGNYTKVDGSLNEAGTHYTFTTGHFSTYAIMSEEEADAVIKDQTVAAQKAAIKNVKTTVTLSTKNVKKGIKVTVKVPVDQKADKTGIILYRSMKKDSGYAMYKKVETKSSTYIITNTKNVKGNRLTAGKRYYYKARAYKVIDGKTYYGPMSTVKYMKAK